MKRVKERSTHNPYYKSRKRLALTLFALVGSLVLLVTTWPKHKLVNDEVVSYTHNGILGIDTDLGYGWVFLGLLVIFISAIVRLINVGSEDFDLPEWVTSAVGWTVAVAIVGGFISVVGLPVIHSMNGNRSSADIVLAEHTKGQTSSASMFLDQEEDAKKLDSIINEVKNNAPSASKKAFIESTFEETKTDSNDYLYRVVEKNDKLYLIGAIKRSKSVSDVFEIGEISESQSRAVSALTSPW